MIQSLKIKSQSLFREEQTSLFMLMMCRFLTELNCVTYKLKHFGLNKDSKQMLINLKGKGSENVFVFANGPSLGALDFKKIKELTDGGEFDLISVNSFASKGIEKYGLTPIVGFFADPSHYRSVDDPKYSLQSEADIAVMNQRGIPAMVPYHFYRKSKFNSSIPYCGVCNVYRNNISDMTKPMGYYSLTAFYALSLALHLDYKNIYICGFDNSYFRSFAVDENNEKYFENKHFYKTEKSPKLLLPTEKYGPTSHIFYDTYRHFKYLEKISKFGKGETKIFNIAKTTFTDAFERNFDLDIYL